MNQPSNPEIKLDINVVINELMIRIGNLTYELATKDAIIKQLKKENEDK